MMRWLLLLLASLSGQQDAVLLPDDPNRCRVGVPSGVNADGRDIRPCISVQDSVTSGNIDWSPSQAIARITFSDRAVPRLRYAIELRDELRKRGRLCDHAEDWDAAIRAISKGAELIEMAVCHHEKKTRHTLYRVAARWLTERDYGPDSVSVVEGVERR